MHTRRGGEGRDEREDARKWLSLPLPAVASMTESVGRRVGRREERRRWAWGGRERRGEDDQGVEKRRVELVELVER
jgi:hypothetical protein